MSSAATVYAKPIKYTPHPTLALFHASSARVRAIVGPYGSGKSSACVHEITSRAEEQAPSPRGEIVRRTRWAVVRNTFGQLRDTTIKTWLDWFPEPSWGEFTWSPYPTYLMRWRLDDRSVVEAEILFRALDRPDHVKNVKSLEITGYWMNEASEIPLAIKDALDARCGRYPSQREGGPTWYGGILDTNPPDTDHWFYRLFEEDRPDNHRIFHQPSGLSADAENLEFLPGGQNYYADLSKGKSREWIAVFIESKYGFVLDGKPVYREVYFPSLHDAEKPITPVRGLEIIHGDDWGLTPATVWFQVLPGPRVLILRELCSESMGAERHADECLAFRRPAFPDHGAEHFRGFADPAGWSKAQTDEKTCADIYAAKGIRLQQGAVDFTSRFEAMRHIFGLIHAGRGAVQIDPRCVVLKKALLGGYHFRRLQVPGAERYTDQPEKNHPYSDIANALEYPISKLFNVPGVTRQEIARQEEGARSRWREVRGFRGGPGTGKRSWVNK